MIPQVLSQVNTQPAKEQMFQFAEVKVTRLSQGEETSRYMVRVNLGPYDEDNEVMVIENDGYYCKCDEYKANAQRGFWSCLHTAAVRLAQPDGMIEDEPIPY